jgi:hypothetical protein
MSISRGRPGGNPDFINHEKRNVFSKDNQPLHRGRRKSVLREYVMESNVIKSDIQKVAQMILEQDLENLKKIASDPGAPLFVVGFAVAALKDMKAGATYAINLLMTWAYGSPDQYIKTENVNVVTEMTPEERNRKLEEILSKKGYSIKEGKNNKK